jgi:YesN/AraC family two-component response regulator
LVLISPLLLHKTTEANSPSHERILINFKPSFIQPISDQFEVDLLGTFHGFPILRPDMKERPVIEALMEKLQKERRKKEPGAEGYLKLLLTELLLWIYRQAQASSEQPTGQEHPTALHRNVSDIVKFINEHYREKLQLHVIAEHFHISLYYLCHIFKEATGFTIIEYINQHRISEAQKLLKSTRLTVTTIAEEVGFDSSTHFGRVFKSVSGLSPLQYRKQATVQ